MKTVPIGVYREPAPSGQDSIKSVALPEGLPGTTGDEVNRALYYSTRTRDKLEQLLSDVLGLL